MTTRGNQPQPTPDQPSLLDPPSRDDSRCTCCLKIGAPCRCRWSWVEYSDRQEVYCGTHRKTFKVRSEAETGA